MAIVTYSPAVAEKENEAPSPTVGMLRAVWVMSPNAF
jgi:hypothetical protein